MRIFHFFLKILFMSSDIFSFQSYQNKNLLYKTTNKNANVAVVICLTRANTKAQRKRLSTSKVFNGEEYDFWPLVPSGGPNWLPCDRRLHKLSFESLISLKCCIFLPPTIFAFTWKDKISLITIACLMLNFLIF